MKKLCLIFCSIFFVACSNEITSLHGHIHASEDNYFTMDCSDQVTKSKGATDDIGYSCRVEITSDTKLRTQDGEVITVKNLPNDAEVTVILTAPKQLGEDATSRHVQAKEIILHGT